MEGVHHQAGIGVGALLQGADVGGAGVGHQSAAAGEHAADLLIGVLAGEAQRHQVAAGQAAGTLRGEGALAVQGVLGVHHPAPHVGAYADAAAHVADDEI